MKLRQLSRFIAILAIATLFATTVTVVHAQGKSGKTALGKTALGKTAGKDQQAAPGGFGRELSFSMPLKKGEDPAERLKLDQVVWSGPVPDLKLYEGKSVLLFFYATWCPKCNAWSGELFRQMMIATANRPVVILAINADERDPTLNYVKSRRFAAPNILHGYDPSIPRRLGYKSNLFSYIWIDPDGLVKESGYMGTSTFADPKERKGPKTYTLAKKLHEAKDLGKFEVIQPDLPPMAAAMLWPLELGQPIDSSALTKARRVLKGKLKDGFDKAIGDYLDGQLEKMTTLSEGEIADQLEAYTKADPFVKQFRAFPQSKKVRVILDKFKKDRDFKKELSAMRLYDKATAKGVPEKRRLGMLRGLVKRFEGTHYATKAAAEIE